MNDEPRTLPIQIALVAIDETDDWLFEKKEAGLIDQIHTVYAFDRNEQTYCAEMTPSFYLIPVEYVTKYTQDANAWLLKCVDKTASAVPTPDELRDIQDEFAEEWEDAIRDVFYDAKPIYVHCSTVEAMKIFNVEELPCDAGDDWQLEAREFEGEYERRQSIEEMAFIQDVLGLYE